MYYYVIMGRGAFIIIIYNKHVLCLEGMSGKYELPGGGVRHGEHSRNGAIRELREETSISLNLRWNNINKVHERTHRNGSITKIYTYKLYNIPKVRISKEHKGFSWKPILWILNNKKQFNSYVKSTLEKKDVNKLLVSSLL